MEHYENKKDSPRTSQTGHAHPTTDPHSKGQADEEFRQTWKMKPKISKKLPSAFSSMTKGSKKSDKVEKRNSKIDSISEALSAEEFKQTQNLLSPIVVDSQRREEMEKGLNKMFDPGYVIPKKITKLEPLDGGASGKSKDDDRKKIPSKHKDMSKLSVPDFGMKKTTIPYSYVKLEEMITLSMLKGNRNSGSIKKMLHAPTLKLFAVKEIPLVNREVRITLKEWISTWQNAQEATDNRICSVYGTFWNVPEGCVSVVMDYENAGSLENLLESVGALPEPVLGELALKMLLSMKSIQENIGIPHGCIVPSQVLFDQEGNVKLNIGVSHRINLGSKESTPGSLGYMRPGSSGVSEAPLSLYDPTQRNSQLRFQKMLGMSKVLKSSKSEGKLHQFKQDVFDLGTLLFISALGGLEIVDTSEFEKIASQKTTGCCALHCHDEKGSEPAESTHKTPGSLLISQYFTLARFTPQFLDFLCKCLRFNEADRLDIDDLLRHPWLNSKLTYKSALVSLQELIQISNQWRQSSPPIEYQGPAEKQLDRICEAMATVLPCCDNYDEILAIFSHGKPEKAVARDLAVDLGLDLDRVWKKLSEVIVMIGQKERLN